MPHLEQVFDEAQLIDRLRAQEHVAFNQLVQHYHLRLVAFAITVVGDALAEEVVQDAWVSIYRALAGFAGKSSLKTWLYTIVRNQGLSVLKKENRQPGTLAAGESGNDPIDDWLASSFAADGHWHHQLGEWHITTPEGLLQEDQLRECIDKHLAQLKPDQKSVFALRDLEQLAMDDVCNILGLSHSNARVLLHRARLRLMQVVDKYQETGEC